MRPHADVNCMIPQREKGRLACSFHTEHYSFATNALKGCELWVFRRAAAWLNFPPSEWETAVIRLLLFLPWRRQRRSDLSSNLRFQGRSSIRRNFYRGFRWYL